MRFWRKLVIIFGIGLLLFLSRRQMAYADGPKFSVSFDISYKIADDGNATVTENFRLTNLTTEFYPAVYVLHIGEANINNLRAYDSKGLIPVETARGKSGIDLKLKLNNMEVGQGKMSNFSVVYNSSEVARKTGRGWQVFIPRPQPLESTIDYTVGLYVPDSFGPVISLRPKPTSIMEKAVVWSSRDLPTFGIMAVYNPKKEAKPYQAYDFSLNYHLYNSRLYPVTSEIAIPPDTNYQKIFLHSLIPTPLDVRIDKDGNWLAKYYLGPAAKLEVSATGSAAVFDEPVFSINQERIGNDYLQEKEYWPVKDEKIRNQANRFKDPKSIFDFVTRTLRYNFDPKVVGSKRLGAKIALANPTLGRCLEFSDLFVTLARAAGIPAREIEGYAYTTNSYLPRSLLGDTLHAWVEYFDPVRKIWTAADPTWTETTGGMDFWRNWDLNHFTLAVHGENSSWPPPAGVYKDETKILSAGSSQKDILVFPTDIDLDITKSPKIAMRADIPLTTTAGWGFSGKIFLENLGPVFRPNETIVIRSQYLVGGTKILESGPLPPMASREMDFSFHGGRWFSDSDDIISVFALGQNRTYSVRIRPIYKSPFVWGLGALILIGIISIIAQVTRSLSLQRRQRESHLCGKGKISS